MGRLEAVNELLGKARKKGKGLIGMKIFGEGKHVSDAERERSIRFAVTESNSALHDTWSGVHRADE